MVTCRPRKHVLGKTILVYGTFFFLNDTIQLLLFKTIFINNNITINIVTIEGSEINDSIIQIAMSVFHLVIIIWNGY